MKMKALIARLQKKCGEYALNGDYKMAKYLTNLIIELLEALEDE
jgi:hypothetical protein